MGGWSIQPGCLHEGVRLLLDLLPLHQPEGRLRVRGILPSTVALDGHWHLVPCNPQVFEAIPVAIDVDEGWKGPCPCRSDPQRLAVIGPEGVDDVLVIWSQAKHGLVCHLLICVEDWVSRVIVFPHGVSTALQGPQLIWREQRSPHPIWLVLPGHLLPDSWVHALLALVAFDGPKDHRHVAGITIQVVHALRLVTGASGTRTALEQLHLEVRHLIKELWRKGILPQVELVHEGDVLPVQFSWTKTVVLWVGIDGAEKALFQLGLESLWPYRGVWDVQGVVLHPKDALILHPFVGSLGLSQGGLCLFKGLDGGEARVFEVGLLQLCLDLLQVGLPKKVDPRGVDRAGCHWLQAFLERLEHRHVLGEVVLKGSSLLLLVLFLVHLVAQHNLGLLQGLSLEIKDLSSFRVKNLKALVLLPGFHAECGRQVHIILGVLLKDLIPDEQPHGRGNLIRHGQFRCCRGCRRGLCQFCCIDGVLELAILHGFQGPYWASGTRGPRSPNPGWLAIHRAHVPCFIPHLQSCPRRLIWDLLTLLAKEALGRLGGPDIVAGGAHEVIGHGAGVPSFQRLGAQTRGPLGVVQAPHRLLVAHALHRDVGLDDAGNRRAAQRLVHEASKELGELELVRAHQHVHQVVRDAREGLREHHQLGVGVVLGVQLEADGLWQARRARGDDKARHGLWFGPWLHIAISHGHVLWSLCLGIQAAAPLLSLLIGFGSKTQAANGLLEVFHLDLHLFIQVFLCSQGVWRLSGEKVRLGIGKVLCLLLGSHHLPVFIFRFHRIHITIIHFHLPFRGHRRRGSRRRRHGSEKTRCEWIDQGDCPVFFTKCWIWSSLEPKCPVDILVQHSKHMPCNRKLNARNKYRENQDRKRSQEQHIITKNSKKTNRIDHI